MAFLQVRVEKELKELAQEVFEQYGLDLSSAVRLFLKKTVAEQEIPFELKYSKKAYEEILKKNS